MLLPDCPRLPPKAVPRAVPRAAVPRAAVPRAAAPRAAVPRAAVLRAAPRVLPGCPKADPKQFQDCPRLSKAVIAGPQSTVLPKLAL